MKSNLPSAHLTAVLSIAGSDSSGGAGIQADIKTITAHKMYAMTAITALTAQNTTGVYDVCNAPSEFVAKQIDCIFDDIPPAAVKIGMVSETPIIEAIAERLAYHNAPHVVVDPVMVSTSGSLLLASNAIAALTENLFPLAEVITPNIPEVEALTQLKITSHEDMLAAGKILAARFSCAVLVKGGHLIDSADDLLIKGNDIHWIYGKKIATNNTHGTGCTLSSAIACNLAAGMTLPDAIIAAKEYVSGALAAGLQLGKGCGPLNHVYAL